MTITCNHNKVVTQAIPQIYFKCDMNGKLFHVYAHNLTPLAAANRRFLFIEHVPLDPAIHYVNIT